MLNATQIADLIATSGSAGQAGKIAAMRRFHLKSRNAQGYEVVDSDAQRRFLDALAEQPTRTSTRTAHPGDMARFSVPRMSNELTPSDLMWLQRLPTDPAKVSFDDAVALASLASASAVPQPDGQPRPKASASDQRLVDSIWRPVKDLHDRRAAQAQLADAQRQHLPIPPEAHAALADAVRAEAPQLTGGEALARAGTTLRDLEARRDRERQIKLTEAQQRLRDLDQAATDRAAVVRDTADLG